MAIIPRPTLGSSRRRSLALRSHRGTGRDSAFGMTFDSEWAVQPLGLIQREGRPMTKWGLCTTMTPAHHGVVRRLPEGSLHGLSGFRNWRHRQLKKHERQDHSGKKYELTHFSYYGSPPVCRYLHNTNESIGREPFRNRPESMNIRDSKVGADRSDQSKMTPRSS